MLAVLAEKWTLLVVSQLAHGPMRTAEIRRSVDGVSEKMLIQTLRKLEAFGLVSRQELSRSCRRAWSTASRRWAARWRGSPGCSAAGWSATWSGC